MVDYSFFYKYSVRYILICKLNNITNTYKVPIISRFILFFSLSKIDDLHMVQCYNYAYLFRFFLGRKAYFTRQKSFFNLGKWTYSFNIVSNIKSNSLYENLFFFVKWYFS